MHLNLLTLGALATTTLALPVLSPAKRQIENTLQIVQATYQQVTQYTSAINSTLDATHVEGVSAAGIDVASVQETVKGEIASIVKILDSVLDVTSDLTVLDDVDRVLEVVTSVTEGLPAVSSLESAIVKRLVPDVDSVIGINTEDLTKDLLPLSAVVEARDLVSTPLDLDSLLNTDSLVKDLPVVVGKRQSVADISGVTDYATAMVSEITRTVGGVSKVVPGVELGDSIPQLSVAITTFITDLDNVVEGVEVAVTNLLKNVPVSVNVLDTKIEA